MVYVEPSFPRGKRAQDEAIKPRKKFKKQSDYGASTANDEKAQKPRQKERRQARLEKSEQDKDELQQSIQAASLQFKTVQEGMLVLGCVYKVQKMDLTVSLPGRLFGTVPLLSISEAYTNRLQNLLHDTSTTGQDRLPGLDDLYAVGDLVYVKIKAKYDKDKRFGLTLDPKDLHSEFSPKHLVEGLVLSATIEEEEDHGYQMNVGVKNVRAFLPTQNVRKNKMEIGANLYCAVEKVTHAKGSSTVILKAFKPHEPRKLEIAEANIDALVPGSVVTFTVETVLSNGLQGTMLDDSVPAFVNENMLEKSLSKKQSYELFKQVQARILYVMPLSKHVFLTLANYDGNKAPVEEPIAPGTVIKDAKIIYKCSSGVWFQIGKKHKALLPRYILKSKYKQNYDEQIVMAKYQLNSVHQVRVIRYEAFDRTIIVTDDDKALGSKYFSLKDVKVGEMYDCRITKVLGDKRGHLVSLDNIKGIVTSHNYAHNKSLAVNQTVKLRLVSIEEDRKMAQFTNHPEYLKKSAKIVTDRKDIKAGQKYLGTVISDQEKFFVVAFCNKITGILFRYCRSVAQNQDKIALVKPGVAGLFTVQDVSDDGTKITLSIPLSANSENLGHITNATVTGVFATGADIYLVKENETGVIPPEMFSDFPSHNAIFQSVLKEGEQLPVVNVREEVYSYRDVDYFKRKPTQLKDVKLGQILRAYCVDKARDGKISFRLALKDYPRKVVLRVKEFASDKSRFQIEEGQVVMVKVMSRITKPEGLVLIVSGKLQSVCSHGVDEAWRYMQTYLTDVKKLAQRLKSRDRAFAQYSVGQTVTCVVESFVEDSDQMVVRLGESKNAAKGIACKDPKKDDYSVGGQLEGRVVWVDVEKQLVHVSVVKKHLKHLIDGELLDVAKELVNVDETREFVTLFKNSYVAVGCLKKVDCPIVIVPVRCHYNDFDPMEVNQKTKVILVRKIDGFMYGLTEDSFNKFKDFKTLVENKPAKEKKECWLPDDFEEPELTESEDDADNKLPSKENGSDSVDGNGQSDSGIDKDEELEESKPAKKLSKKSKKKLKLLKANKPNAVASPGKALKANKSKKKAAAKKLKGIKPFVISQLDGADDFTGKTNTKFNKNKAKKHFLSERPTAKAPNIARGKQSGFSNTKQDESLEKKDKLQQLTRQKKFKNNQNKKKFPVPVEIIEEVKQDIFRQQKSSSKRGTLPGAESFWNSNPAVNKQDSESSDDEDQAEVQTKKRLTGKERFEAVREEEKRIRKIEEELADASVDPHTPDQFDRLVLSQPNSSLLWIRYMVFHMESAEIEKARAVARRALKAINFREESERLNVWVALLNLELRYETVETFKEVLQEAIQYNDAFKVYSKVIEVLIDCGNVPEVLEIIDILQKRFRKQPEMWLLIANSYYKIEHRSKVKPLLSKALKSLENKEHIPLIVKFAFVHNRNGDRDEAHILFEQILTSYPKRTDIWSQYVDMLVKDGMVDVARQTLDRAIAQRLPMRNMKTLYTKYVNFEEQHGDRDAVKKVKQMAADYVKQQLGANGVDGGGKN